MKNKMKNWLRNKKGLEIEMLGWWLIGLAVLVVVVIGYMILSGKGASAIQYIKNLIRFRG